MASMAKGAGILTIEAVIDADGNVRLSESVKLPGARRALVTILEEEAAVSETAVLSEPALAVDWDRPEEDEIWAPFQQTASTGRLY